MSYASEAKPNIYHFAYEDDAGKTIGATVTLLGDSLPISCQAPSKRLNIRNFRISTKSLNAALEGC